MARIKSFDSCALVRAGSSVVSPSICGSATIRRIDEERYLGKGSMGSGHCASVFQSFYRIKSWSNGVRGAKRIAFCWLSIMNYQTHNDAATLGTKTGTIANLVETSVFGTNWVVFGVFYTGLNISANYAPAPQYYADCIKHPRSGWLSATLPYVGPEYQDRIMDQAWWKELLTNY
jgi:hypothetical protein